MVLFLVDPFGYWFSMMINTHVHYQESGNLDTILIVRIKIKIK